MSRRSATAIAITLAMLAVAWVTSGILPPRSAESYVERWAPILLALADPVDTRFAPYEEWRRGVWVCRFHDGSWVAMRPVDSETAHTAPNGYSATVLADSEGRVRYSTAHVCSPQLLEAELPPAAVEATTLGGFHAALDVGMDFVDY